MSHHGHPVHQILEAAAHGYFPGDDELAELGLDDEIVDAIRDAAGRIVALHASENRGAARREAKDATRSIAELVPAGWRPPADDDETPAALAAAILGYTDDPENPRNLAARIPR